MSKNWSQMKIGEAITFNPSEKLKEGMRSRKISMDKLRPHTRRITGFEYAPYGNGPKFRNGDTLLAKITPCLENGKTARVDVLNDGEVAFGSSEFIVLRENEHSKSDFIYYFAISPEFRTRAITCMEGTTGRKRVNENVLKSHTVSFPDVGSQEKIATVLSSLDSKIELNNRINTELEAMTKTLFDYWFVQFDFPNASGKPYKSSGGKMVYCEALKRDIPKDWILKTLGAVTSVATESVNPANFPDKLFKHLSIPSFDAVGSFFEEKGETIGSNKFKVCSTDILVSKLNPKFSRVIYVTNEEDLICSTEFVVWRPENQKLKPFLYSVAKDLSFITFCQQSASGTSNSHKRINPTVMMGYQIAYNQDVCELFGKHIESSIKKMMVNNLETKQLTSLRDLLLPMLMNGQVTVT